MSETLPARLGPYRILRLLGEGSSGRVYLAEQDEPRREVALKVLRNTALSGDARLRFAREAELLAQLEHPGIARVYAAGVIDTDTGPLPYLALEYVHGVELLEYARRHALDLAAKLALVAAICRAVHYAHARGIVHRDLKPANILVDADGQPHILDFGIAHVAQDRFATMTIAGQVLGTVPYMSAEQLAGRVGASDPRCDVYSLGVIAYELICGQLPYPGLSTSTVIEAIAIIRSGRIEKLSKLAPQARGDVETVVMKAMAQEAPRRYGSAAELAADFERYLQHQPIEARPPTARYLLGLFVRRHRAVSAAIAVAILALVGAAVISLNYAISEARAHAIADQRAAEFAAVNRFLNEMLVSADPAHTRGRDVTVAETLDAARLQLPNDHSLTPEAGAALAATLSNTYAALGDVDTALKLARDARIESEKALGPGSEAAIRLRLAEASALHTAGDLKAGNALLAPLIDQPTPAGEDPRLRFQVRLEYATALLYMGEHELALQALEKLDKDATARLGASDSTTLEVAQGYTSILFNTGRYEQAIAGFRELIGRETAALGADHPMTLLTRMDYADRLRQLARYDEAEKQIRSVIADRTRVSGPTHYWTLLSNYVLCNVLDQAGHPQQAEAPIGPVVDGLRSSLGDRSSDTLNAMFLQANIERHLGHYALAERQYRDVIALRAQSDSATHPESLFPVEGLALTLIETGRSDEALRLLQDALPKADGRSEHNVLYGRLLGSYAYAQMRKGRWQDARVSLEKSAAIVGPPTLDLHHPVVQTVYARLLTVYRQLGLTQEADRLAPKVDPSP
ncbi:serine/threonine-protein kinase [Solimonas terrae]|uniref:Protein kinase n=1 Tax=Solimonas terrae TaxID=1396819 RepID=A0A6M2BS96_9GAMM|nr:serine/threonine-protein kinase [Solimonas terrae]NGY05476.1 protein kinase [Solimonas terrae]